MNQTKLGITLSSEATISKTHIKHKIHWLQTQSFKAWRIAASLIFILRKKITPAREKSSCWQLKNQPPHKYCCKILLHAHTKRAGKHMLHPPLVLNYYRITTLSCYCFLQPERRLFCSNPRLSPINKPGRWLPHVKASLQDDCSTADGFTGTEKPESP